MVAERKSALLLHRARCRYLVPGLHYKVIINVVSGGTPLKAFCHIFDPAKDIRRYEANQGRGVPASFGPF
jgi:hypothetical protein